MILCVLLMGLSVPGGPAGVTLWCLNDPARLRGDGPGEGTGEERGEFLEGVRVLPGGARAVRLKEEAAVFLANPGRGVGLETPPRWEGVEGALRLLPPPPSAIGTAPPAAARARRVERHIFSSGGGLGATGRRGFRTDGFLWRVEGWGWSRALPWTPVVVTALGSSTWRLLRRGVAELLSARLRERLAGLEVVVVVVVRGPELW